MNTIRSYWISQWWSLCLDCRTIDNYSVR